MDHMVFISFLASDGLKYSYLSQKIDYITHFNEYVINPTKVRESAYYSKVEMAKCGEC